jgi:hypothetical protein
MFIVPVRSALPGPFYHITTEDRVEAILSGGLDAPGRAGSATRAVYLTRAEFLAWWLLELPQWHGWQGAASATRTTMRWRVLAIDLNAVAAAHMDRAGMMPLHVPVPAEVRLADMSATPGTAPAFPIGAECRVLADHEAEGLCRTALTALYRELLNAPVAPAASLLDGDWDYQHVLARWTGEAAQRLASPLAYLAQIASPRLLDHSAPLTRAAAACWARAGDRELADRLARRAATLPLHASGSETGAGERAVLGALTAAAPRRSNRRR